MSQSTLWRRGRAFTIVELLVVVSIIALLIGILLPAINKARDQARVTQSKANLRNIGVAHAAYGSDFNDRQWTLVRDDFAAFNNNGNGGGDPLANCATYVAKTGCHPSILIGNMSNGGGFYVAILPCEGLALGGADCGGAGYLAPHNFWGTGPAGINSQHVGSSRYNNVATFTTYINNRYYDPTFWAPKDKILLDDVEKGMQDPGGMTDDPNPPPWPTYALSAAAMFSPDVLRNTGSWTANSNIPGRYKGPTAGAAVYSDLKTRSMEHNWLQNAQADVNPKISTNGQFKTPYFYNAALNSAPVALFFDGHVDMAGVFDAIDADARAVTQGGASAGLWCRNTPTPFGATGYHKTQAYDTITQTGYHMFTTNGILGRDLSTTGG
jgi:type II secretory pathway pseudopilin PulG